MTSKALCDGLKVKRARRVWISGIEGTRAARHQAAIGGHGVLGVEDERVGPLVRIVGIHPCSTAAGKAPWFSRWALREAFCE